MMKVFRKVLKLLLLLLAGAIALIVLYGLAAALLSCIPVNKNWQAKGEQLVDIYFISNGVHFDILLPVKNEFKDWTHEVVIDDTKDLGTAYLGFGWGDKGFYLTTPTWDDLTFSTAFKALFLKSESAMHVTFYPQLSGYPEMKKLRISPLQYQYLAKFITASFKRDDVGNTLLIEGLSYGDQDQFYEAKRSYSLFYTCNTWVNEAFMQSGIRACVWTPFDKGLLFQFRDLK